MATVATPPDSDGYASLSLHSGATVDAIHRAGADPDRLLVVETNAKFPRTFGSDLHPHRVHVDEIDVIVESDREPFLLPDPAATDADRAIAEHVRPLVPDGATLQTGIGGIPSTVVGILANGDGGDYGIHSEMFTTGLMQLHRAGKVSNRHKGQFDGVSVTTFAAGTAELYEWLDENREVMFLPVDIVNAPDVIARNRSMITLNGALSVDLHGQVVADSIGGRQFSGIGGHEDFIAQSGLSLEDRSLVCLRSTSVIEGVHISRIVPALPEGWIVTTPRHQLDLVVTEFGVAHLRGRTVRERARGVGRDRGPGGPRHPVGTRRAPGVAGYAQARRDANAARRSSHSARVVQPSNCTASHSIPRSANTVWSSVAANGAKQIVSGSVRPMSSA